MNSQGDSKAETLVKTAKEGPEMADEKEQRKRLATFNQEKFQSEVARELGIDLSSADEVTKPGQEKKPSASEEPS